MNISFEHIKENCQTIGDLKKLTDELVTLMVGGKTL